MTSVYGHGRQQTYNNGAAKGVPEAASDHDDGMGEAIKKTGVEQLIGAIGAQHLRGNRGG